MKEDKDAGTLETYLGRCLVDPKKKLQGPGVSNEVSTYINYYSVFHVLQNDFPELNAESKKTNGAWLRIDRILCNMLAYQATTYEANMDLIVDLISKDLIDPAELQ